MKINDFIYKAIRYVYLHSYKYRANERTHRKLIENIDRSRPVNVTFLAMNVSMWRYQGLWEVMNEDKRFNVSIVLSACVDYNREQNITDLKKLRAYFAERNMPYVDYDLESNGAPADIRKTCDPLLMFYPQHYEHLLVPEHDCMAFYDRLICYYPYAFWTSDGKWSYDFHFHNLAWRLYYSTQMHLDDAVAVATNKGRNVRVVGYPSADDFLKGEFADVWKKIPDGRRRLRIVWAPHFSIVSQFHVVPKSNFLWMAQYMLDFARKHQDDMQFAFKPHPRLLNELYIHPDWGKEKADAYYAEWQSLPNGQTELGGFADLLMTSDAMVHDCGSFSVEYHYSRKPVMFVSQNLDDLLASYSEFGRKAINLHYIGSTRDDIERFLQDVVMNGNDPKKAERDEFYNSYLLPPNGKTVAQNTLDDIIESLRLK